MVFKFRQVAFLLLVSCSSVQADKLDFLFTTESQRETLNTVRDQYQRGLYREGGVNNNQLGYKFNGIVSKKGAAKVLWVNGSPVKTTKPSPNARGEYRIDLPLGQVKIKPGQIYQPSSSKVIEAFDEQGVSENE